MAKECNFFDPPFGGRSPSAEAVRKQTQLYIELDRQESLDRHQRETLALIKKRRDWGLPLDGSPRVR